MNTKEKIDYLIKHFDFKKVHKVMKFLNWEYYGSKGVPSISTLEETARKLLRDVAKNKHGHWIESGGFRAFKHNYKEGNLKSETIYGLQFIVASYDSLIC
jgi:hypothetical protein